jgi:PAS domain S-box-containing protein
MHLDLDIRTLVFVLGITHIIQMIVFSSQYLINRNYRGIGCWLIWSAAEVMGFTFLLLREIPSIQLIAIICQNAMIISGVIFLYVGIVRFLGKKENLALVVSIFVLFVAAFLYFIFVKNDIHARSIIIAVTLAIIAFMTAHTLLVHRPAFVAASANFTAGLFLVHGCFFAFRAVMLFTGTPDNMFIPTLLNVVSYIDALVSSILWTFFLILMINQRLNGEMKEAKEEMELVFNTSPDAATISRLSDGLIVHVNEGFTFLSGFTRDEAMGKSSLNINIWKDPMHRKKIVDELLEKGLIENYEARFQKKDGSQFSGLLSARTINLQNIPHIISITRDITSLKQSEEEKRHSEKLSAALEMAGTICHEMNQPLQVISGRIELLSMEHRDENTYKSLETMKDQVRKMGIITRKLMGLREYSTCEYVGTTRITDIDAKPDAK